MNTQAKLRNGEETEAAMGQWKGVKYHGLEWFDHSGSDAGYRAYFSRFPEHNAGVVVLGNMKSLDASDFGLSIAELYLESYFKEEQSKKKGPAELPYSFVQLSKAQLSPFCGKYWEPDERYNREIRLVNDTLIYYRSENSQTKLAPVGPNEFKMLGDQNDVSVFFETDERYGSVMRLNIDNGSKVRTVHFVKYDPDLKLEQYTGTFYSPEVEQFIQIDSKEKGLQVQLLKRTPINLEPVTNHLFKASDRVISRIEFIPGKKGKISALFISNGSVTNLRYMKVDEKRLKSIVGVDR